MKKQNFVEGALILMIANLLVKVFGAIFKIPLTNIIGVEAMGYFNTAYGFYVIFYMISTGGLPVAVSKMISAADAKQNKKEVEKIFKISHALFFIFGAIGMVIMTIFASTYANYVKLEGLEWAIFAISPTLFFICLTSAYRGYFQGHKNMTPTAVSQVCEAIGKLVIGLILAFWATDKSYSPHIVAAFSLIGVTIGAVLSTVVLKVYKNLSVSVSSNNPAAVSSGKKILKNLIIIAIPVTLSATVMSLTNTIDTTFMVKRLISAGFDSDAAKKIMGSYTSMSVPLFNLPPNLIYPFAISIIPALTSSIISGKRKESQSIMTSTFRIATIISVPCALGLSLFARPIISLLYTNKEIIYTNTKGIDITSVDVAAPLLSVLSVSIFFVSIISVTNSILQANGYETKTIISTISGILVKLALTLLLISNSAVGMYGAPLSTLISYIVITAFNLYFVAKYVGYIPNIKNVFLKPIIAGMISIGAGAGIQFLVFNNSSSPKSVVFTILICAVFYFALLFAFRGVEKEDILLLPKGEKIANILKKIKVIK